MDFTVFSYTNEDLILMPPRTQNSNKSTYGRVLCVCGSVGMAGAAYLSALSALRCGAGLVEILSPEQNRTILQTNLPEAIVTSYDATDPDTDIVDSALSRADAVVCGCGLGITPASRKLLAHILRNCTLPTVLDADALNLISRNPSLKKYLKGKIITPHPMELSRLATIPVEQITYEPARICHDLASTWDTVCVLKGHATVVSDGQGEVYLNGSGNSGMATAGSGDVLAGIIGGILSQNKDLTPLQVASLGVYVHGLAGDAAAAHLGEYSVIASDIISCLSRVLKIIKNQ